MVVGAHQVGKTYSVSSFCETQFESYYRFDFMKDEDIVSIFGECKVNREVEPYALNLHGLHSQGLRNPG